MVQITLQGAHPNLFINIPEDWGECEDTVPGPVLGRD